MLEPEEGKKQIVIDQVRSTISALTLTSSFSPYKLALICPAEAMNTNAANALLKSLEEPPGDTLLILVSHDPSRLPVTIRSRCQSITVAIPEQDVAVQWLEQSQGIDGDTARQALVAGTGSPLWAAEIVSTGQLESHQRLQQQLSALLGRPGMVSRVASEISDIEDRTLWAWLSHSSADLLKAVLSGIVPTWMEKQLSVIDCRELAILQTKADKNRFLSDTPVRQDLLLQDWLIKWAKLEQGIMATSATGP
jgi:DNA polymerase-3 subunit delta'